MDDILKNLFGGGFGGGMQFWKGWFRTRIWRKRFWSLWFWKTALLEADLMVVSAVEVLMVPVMEMALETAAMADFSGSHQQKGQDLNAEISISFNEAAFGCDKLINLSGADGSGKQTLKVHIPAGIDNGKSIRLRGKGNPGYGGAPAGDLLLKVHVGERLL